jgi:capsular exopolysaccharide synthesis family protein
MDFRQVGRALRANVLIALAVFIAIVVIGGAAAYLPAKKYQASVLLLAVPAQSAIATGGGVAYINYILPQLAIVAQDDAQLSKVVNEVPAALAHVPVSVAAVSDPSTGTVTLTGTSINPAAAAAFVNTDARILLADQKNKAVYSLLEPSPAQVPDTASNPGKPLLVGAIAFAAIAAVFAAMGADAVRRRVNQVEETRLAANLPVLAEVPRAGRTALRPSLVFSNESEPLVLEAFQELRSNLLLALPADRPTSVAILSGEAGEGKSSVAADLAWALASEHRLVTVVDCDLRRPTMHLLLGAATGPGVSGRLSSDLDHLMSTTRNPYLTFIPAGIPDRHPVDIVSSYVPSLLSELQEQGRHVVVDCPPLNGVAETLLLASMVDVVVLVVDARHFDPARVQQSQARLQEAGATVIGVVLNRVRAKRRNHSYGYATTTPYGDDVVFPAGSAIRHDPGVVAKLPGPTSLRKLSGGGSGRG